MPIRYSSSGGTPFGGTSDRPSSPLKGQTFFNGDTGILEIYTGSAWRPTNIPFGNTAGRPANPTIGQPYFNGEVQRLEVYNTTYGWQNIVAETPGVTGYAGTVVETNTTNTISITGTNFTSGATAALIGTDGTEYAATSTTVNNLTSITATFGAISAALEPYDIKVTNPSNLYGVYYDILTVNDKPIWQTAAGSLGTFSKLSSISVTVVATDEENNTITYSVASGSSLPSGITLNSSTGVISGTLPDVASDTTYTFTLNASDGLNTSQSRVFSIMSQFQINVEALVVAGGGGGGYDRGSGGGAGGLIDHPTFKMSRGTQYTITVGNGGTAGNSGNVVGGTGGNSILGSLTALGGGGGNMTGAGQNGGSGGGGGWNTSTAGTGLQPSQAGDSGTYGYGYAGGAGGSNIIGGGGGAGAAGSSSSPSTSSNRPNGGIGRQSSITGTSTYYAGGGGGGQAFDGPSGNTTPYFYLQGFGGTGGGGNGGNTNGGAGFPGTANTGGGGGGGANIPQGVGAAGGSGVVIIAYTNNYPAITNIPGTLTYDQPTRSGYRVYRFTAGTGTITF